MEPGNFNKRPELPDLSVEPGTFKMMREQWRAVIRIRLGSQAVTMHPGTLKFVTSHIANRFSYAGYSDTEFTTQFAVDPNKEDGEYLATHFANSLTHVLGRSPWNIIQAVVVKIDLPDEVAVDEYEEAISTSHLRLVRNDED